MVCGLHSRSDFVQSLARSFIHECSHTFIPSRSTDHLLKTQAGTQTAGVRGPHTPEAQEAEVMIIEPNMGFLLPGDITGCGRLDTFSPGSCHKARSLPSARNPPVAPFHPQTIRKLEMLRSPSPDDISTSVLRRNSQGLLTQISSFPTKHSLASAGRRGVLFQHTACF